MPSPLRRSWAPSATASMLPLLLLILLQCFVVPAEAQSAVVPYAPMVIIALILALMAAALLVVAIVVCHFAMIRRASVARRAAGGRRRPEPSTIPKKSAVAIDLKQKPQPQPPQQKRQPEAEPNQYLATADIQVYEQHAVEAVQPQQQQRHLQSAAVAVKAPPVQQSTTDMRDTASQFLEFLSRKWGMQKTGGQPEQHQLQQHKQQQQQQPKELTTFRSPARPQPPPVASGVQIQPSWPNLADSFFDLCEEDVGQYDNLLAGKAAAPAFSSREADRYEVAMELRDTRPSGTSTPAFSARDVELSEAEDTLRSGGSADWFEEVSSAL